MERLTTTQFKQVCQENWPELMLVEFKCPACKTVQTGNDLISAGAGETKEEIEPYLGFSCLGRWDKSRGCDWTLGGLFKIHKLEVVSDDGEYIRPCFELYFTNATHIGRWEKLLLENPTSQVADEIIKQLETINVEMLTINENIRLENIKREIGAPI